ncbi:hypothetical protein C1N61_33080 (plasmid) [Priestia aryabhattai]
MLLIGYFKLAYTPSHDVEEFPIPREAHLVKTTVGEDYITEKYKWFIASEAGSIPPWYQVSIWLRDGEREIQWEQIKFIKKVLGKLIYLLLIMNFTLVNKVKL